MVKLGTRTGELKDAKTANTVQDHFITLSPSDPLTSAIRLLDLHFTQDGVRTLHYHDGAFHAYTGTHYREVVNQDIRAQVYEFLRLAKRVKEGGGFIPFEPNQPKVTHVLDALKAVSFVNSETKLPAWLNDSNIPAGEILACKNGLLHLPTRRLIEHTPSFFSCECLNFSYDPGAPTPKQWLMFLRQLWPHDPVSIRLLQMWFGYCLWIDTQQQKILLIIGPLRAGKGVIARILRKLLGITNTVSPTFFDLTQPFGLQPLINKRLAIISDARLGKGADQSLALERLLSISGEDQQTVHRKYRESWNGTLPVKFMVLTNELPELKDPSGAAVSRLVVLKLTKSFLGEEDTTLTSSLATELPSILNWALYGLKQLQERGHFVQPKSAKRAVEQLEDLGSPVSEFIKDKCKIGSNCSVSTDRLFRAWKRWCESQNVQPGSMSVFGRSLSSYAPSVEKKRPRKAGRKGRYIGIKLA